MISTTRLWRFGRDQLSAWLPALMMMVFALGTWWLVRSAPSFLPPQADSPPLHEADYHMSTFSVRSFDADGKLESELRGIRGRHFPDTDELEVDDPSVRSWDRQGHLLVGSAQRGIASGDGTDIRLHGDALVVRKAVVRPDGQLLPPLEIRGDYLRALIDDERVDSNQPVELLRGTDRFTGDTFAYDHKSGVADLSGRVRGVIQPRPR